MKSVQIQLTSICNQQCFMCRKYLWGKSSIPIKTLEEKIIKYKDSTFTFSGGDPLSYSHLDELTELLIKHKIKYQVFTNLNYDLKGPRITFLLNAEFIQVSLDGSTSATYRSVRMPDGGGKALDLVLTNIHTLYSFGSVIKINCTVSSRNYFDVINIAKLLSKYKNMMVRFWPVHTDEDAKLRAYMYAHIERQVEEYKNYSFINNTNLLSFKFECLKPYEGTCNVKNNHRVIDEYGLEYTCCRAINDNGEDVNRRYAISNNNFNLEDEKELYPYCSGCDRYRKFNENWEKYSTEECYL